MNEDANISMFEKLIERQDTQFQQVRDELKELSNMQRANVLSIKDLVSALSESSLEHRQTRKDFERLEKRQDDQDDDIEILKAAVLEKKANQKIIITIYSTILASFFTFIGWVFGKS